jgi:RNA polymerase sigma-70 factor (ECF subfamily)
MLQVVLGIDAARIANAFLVAPATMSQRLVRAKHKIAAAGIPLNVPAPEEWPARLEAVLAAVYATFGEGWDDPSGSDVRSAGLAQEAIWLGRVLAAACPREPEVLGLLALMLYAHARRDARRVGGVFVPLEHQDPGRWDAPAIEEAETLVKRAAALRSFGRFGIEAAIQSAHVARRVSGETDWGAIADLYSVLLERTASPVVALNRAAALGRARGPEPGLAALAPLDADPRLQRYQPYWATRAELLASAGREADARAAYRRALEFCSDPAVRDYLAGRAALVLQHSRVPD